MGYVFNLNFFFCRVAGITLQAGQRAKVLDSPLLAAYFCLKIGIDCISFLNYSPKQTAPSSPLFWGLPACSAAAVKLSHQSTSGLSWQDLWRHQTAPGCLCNTRVASRCLHLSEEPEQF